MRSLVVLLTAVLVAATIVATHRLAEQQQPPDLVVGLVVSPTTSPARTVQGPVARAHHSRDLRPRRDTLNWAALAQCESSGHWHDNTGNGYYGGLQFDQQTWASVGGGGLPSDATRAEQLHRGRLLYADRGRQPWPVCGALL